MHRSLQRLGLPHTDAVTPGVPLPVDPERTTILTASDADEEVRAAVRAVIDAVRAGTRLDRIAVLHASPEPYGRLAHEQLQAGGHHDERGRDRCPPRPAWPVARCSSCWPSPRATSGDRTCSAWLAAAPILHDGRWAPTAAWERISRDAKVVGGRADWEIHLTQHAAQQDARAEELDKDDDEPDWAVERARSTAGSRGLQSFVLRLIDDLAAAVAEPRRWSQHATWAHAWLVGLLGPAVHRGTWPEVEQKAAERVERALDRLGALDAVEGPVDLRTFTRTLELELEADLGRVGRFGDGVLVGSIEMGIGLDLDLVIVLGLAEGSFPAGVRDDSLLPDSERAHTSGELAPAPTGSSGSTATSWVRWQGPDASRCACRGAISGGASTGHRRGGSSTSSRSWPGRARAGGPPTSTPRRSRGCPTSPRSTPG